MKILSNLIKGKSENISSMIFVMILTTIIILFNWIFANLYLLFVTKTYLTLPINEVFLISVCVGENFFQDKLNELIKL